MLTLINFQTSQAMYYDVDWGAFVEPLLQWKSNKYYVIWRCICSLRYPACNAHGPFCRLWPV